MNLVRWIIRSLLFYKWIWLGILLSAAAASAVLTGSLLVGDSVRITLARQMENRLGRVHIVLLGPDTFFRPQLAGELAASLNTETAGVLMLNGRIENVEGTRRVNRIAVIGVDESFARLSPWGQAPWIQSLGGGLVVNADLAGRLGAAPGDEVIVSLPKTGGLSVESVLSPLSEAQQSIRLTIAAVASENAFGSFGLSADSSGTLNAFADRRTLAGWIGLPDRANAVLIGKEVDPHTAAAALRKTVRPEDLGLSVRTQKDLKFIEVQSRNVFIKHEISEGLLKADPAALGVLTYFVNEIAKDGRSTPYSMVSAIGSSDPETMNTFTRLADNEIILNEWLADDLKADAGDTVTLKYFVPGSKTDRLIEQTESFRVHSVIPMMGLGADPTLMPAFPALADADSCRDWKPGIPIDLSKIRPQDEAYWNKYRGAPKAFLSLPAARRLWANRFGDLTAVRYPEAMTEQRLTEILRQAVDPTSGGLVFDSIRCRGQKAAAGMTDFGSLFAGLSMFLVGSALILTALTFHFAVERQIDQIGLLKAVGFTTGRIRWMYLAQGLILAGAGAILGVLLALVYTRLLIWALWSLWSDAVAGAAVEFYVHIPTLLLGAAVGLFVSLISMLIGLRNLMLRPAAALLGGVADPPSAAKMARWNLPLSILLALLGFALVIGSLIAGVRQAASVFFLSAVLLLSAVIFMGRFLLSRSAAASRRPPRTILYLAVRNLSRRPGRSLTVLTTMAAGVFLVTAVGLNRKSVPRDVLDRQSGTGGFVLLAESGLPVLGDLNDPNFQRELNLDLRQTGSAAFVPLRVRAGEDAGCLNLNRAQQPRLLGVSAAALRQRKSFAFGQVLKGTLGPQDGWDLLDLDFGPDIVPAVGDIGTVHWGLGLRVGDTLTQQDENGRPFQLKIVAILESSVLQGSLLISEGNFTTRFGSVPGYQMFLIDAVPEKADKLSAALTKTLRRYGLEVISTRSRLAAFNAVENTYLAIFLVLGGLGLMLGTVGLGLVVWLNILDRRGELAMMQAVGFDRPALIEMLWMEHTILLAAGVLAGALAALVAVLPALSAETSAANFAVLLITLALILASGWLWIRLASAAALSGTALQALRNE
jgi:ABC-type lipoprotein release transport system permease subunit